MYTAGINSKGSNSIDTDKTENSTATTPSTILEKQSFIFAYYALPIRKE